VTRARRGLKNRSRDIPMRGLPGGRKVSWGMRWRSIG
jgi:hypothetical protein